MFWINIDTIVHLVDSKRFDQAYFCPFLSWQFSLNMFSINLDPLVFVADLKQFWRDFFTSVFGNFLQDLLLSVFARLVFIRVCFYGFCFCRLTMFFLSGSFGQHLNHLSNNIQHQQYWLLVQCIFYTYFVSVFCFIILLSA